MHSWPAPTRIPGKPYRHPRRPPRREPRLPLLVRLACVLALAGIGLASWAFWLSVQEFRDLSALRTEIEDSCQGLVDPDEVLRLNGGMPQHVRGSAYSRGFDTPGPLGLCRVHRTAEPGSLEQEFVLGIASQPTPGSTTRITDRSDREDFRHHFPDDPDVPHTSDGKPSAPRAGSTPPNPLGDGTLGHYDRRSATVYAVCRNPARTTGNVTSVRATARVRDKYPSPDDLASLTRIAHRAARRVADRAHCTPPPGAPPAQLAAPESLFTPVTSTPRTGTCGWYGRFVSARGRGAHPDLVLGAPTGSTPWTEQCQLLVSVREGARISARHALDHPAYRSRLAYIPYEERIRFSPWLVRAETRFGDETAGVFLDGLGIGLRREGAVAPGGAGRKGAGIWWASSVCGGRPALHTLTVPDPYDSVIQDGISPSSARTSTTSPAATTAPG
ncbi:hypothetical protein SSPIM334S_05614 [Streptomyces spiroverticillatus]